MKLHTTAAFDELPGILRSGAVLSRVKFNVGGSNGGFNNKNRKDRTCPVHHDTARKFYKDTDPCGDEALAQYGCAKVHKAQPGL